MRALLIILVVILLSGLCYAQCDGSAQHLVLGAAGDQKGHSLAKTADGGYFLAYSTTSGFGQIDWGVAKLGADLDIIWSKYLGTTSDETGDNILIYEASDGDIVVAGYVGSSERNLLFGMLTSDGTPQWFKYLDATIIPGETPADVAEVGPEEFILVGTTNGFAGGGNSDGMILKFTGDGTIEVLKSYGTSQNQHLYSIMPLPNGNYLCAGGASAGGTTVRHGWLVEIDEDCNIVEDIIHASVNDDYFMDTSMMPDGRIAVTGATNAGSYELLMVVLNSDYSIQSSKRIGSSSLERGSSVHYRDDGMIVFTGITQGYSTGAEGLLSVITDDALNVQQFDVHGYGGDDGQSLYSQNSVLDAVGEIILCGWTNDFGGGYQIALYRLNSCGDSECSDSYTPSPVGVVMNEVTTSNIEDPFSGLVNYTMNVADHVLVAVADPCPEQCTTIVAADISEGCEGDTLNVEVLIVSDAIPGSVSWEFEDGSIWYGSAVEGVISGSGMQQVELTIVTDNPLCDYTATYSFDILPSEECIQACVLDVDMDEFVFCQGELGALSATIFSEVEVIEVFWTLPDGAVLDGNDVLYAFPDAGNFDVVLNILTSDPLCYYADTISVEVTPFEICNPDCITIESALIPEFCVGQMDTLSVLIISESPVTQVSWIFEDGSVFPGNEVYVDFDAPGPVNVQLWIETENVLCYYDETYVINVLSEEECLPDCNTDITWDVDAFCVGVSDSLAVLVTSDAAVQSILWILPDGTTLEGNPVEVTFPDAGPVEVEVQVLTDLSSCDVYESIIVDVSDEGPCDMECITSIEPLWSTVCADSLQSLELNISTESEVISVEWTFEDGTVLTGNPVDYEFTNLGVEEIALFVTTSDTLCNLQEILNIEVYDPDSCFGDCETSLNYSIPDPCAGEEIVCSVDVTSNADITGIVWNMPDDGAYDGADIVYTFSEPGSYAVQVIVTTDPPQCGISQWIQVEVSEVEATSPVVVPVCDEYWPIAASELPFTSADGTWEELDLNNPDFEPEEGDYTFMLNTVCGPVAQLVSLVNVGPCDCAPMWIPNVFTPDKDAFNETWYPVFASPPVWCEIVVWSRWGLEVFRTNEWDERWIGNHQGGTHYVQPDVYYFIVKYQCRDGEPIRSEAGHVTVLR